MNDTSNTAAQLDQAEEDILNPTVSDEAIEAAAGIAGGVDAIAASIFGIFVPC
jgi:hypothetical protein